ncbi:chromosome segregation protein SMC [Humidisolicoccus flavus]|uniref:chromosome segregation protein SMC n=1 Tax=Humidisolicoccus flavus TaxID=3111414 RepID=UPI003255BEBC
MYLKTLTIKGFKSFAHATTFQFEPGVTCVVGPNGSGKSNVVDALAWVMGEQGAKTLRGGKMEDVIFAGTATTGPLGRAQVELTIDNSDGALPIEYAEVSIRRTLFRNGGSEYAINGETARLLDVQELLSDSGLGREMHVIVGQGQLDGVLQATPSDRRGYIEEAAGILKHRRRKEKTLRKLDAMQANLTRLSDLAGEIRRQLKPLGQQAEIAKEAQSIQSEVRDAKARLFAAEVVQLRAHLANAARNESERKSQRIVLQEQLDQAALRATRIEESMVGDEVDRARRISNALEREQARLQALSNLATQRVGLLADDDVPVGTERLITQAMVDEAEAAAHAFAEQLDTAQQGVVAAGEAVRAARSVLDSLDEEIQAQSALVSKHDLEAAAHRSKVDVARSTLTALERELERREAAVEHASVRLREAEEAAQLLGEETESEGSDALSQQYHDADAAVASLSGVVERARDAVHEFERERGALSAKVSAFGAALANSNASGDIVDANLDGVDGLVADHVTVRPGYERSIAAALGTLGEAVLASARAAAVAAVEHAHQHSLGRVDVVIAAAAPAGTAIAAPAGAVRATDVVDAPDGILGILSQTLIVDSLSTAITVREALSADASSTAVIVTKNGDIMTEYLLTGGESDSQSRLELLAERDAAAVRLSEVEGELTRAATELERARSDHDAAKSRSTAALETLRAHDAASAQRGEERSRIRTRLESAVAEHERSIQALAEAKSNVDRARGTVDAAERALADFGAKPRPMLDASQRDQLVADLDSARAAETEQRIDLETARERIRLERERAASLARELAAQHVLAEQQAKRAALRRRQREAAESVAEALPAVLDALRISVDEARVSLAEKEVARRANSEQLGKLRREEGSLRDRLHELTEGVHVLEMESYEKKLHLSGLLERAGAELGLDEQVLIAEYSPDEEFDRAAQQQRLTAAERKMARLGRVNPLALEEFAALEQRHKFLTEQLQDLVNTRKDLEQIIADLDERMRDIFADAFEDTKAAFAEVFPVLFPGGSGSLALTDPENLLETGVEVAVRPAGKKIDRLSLLSGGERSLAAVALMVAIFRARPSPFYIMDEVEAALDDANLGRLLTIFEQLRESSQLIVITHQKRTMEIADALYGVSMRRDGVSAVVGQRTRRVEPV